MTALLASALPPERSYGLHDRAGNHWHLIDLDPTVLARQCGTRHDADPERPPPAAHDHSSAPGYAGRKRGTSVRARTAILWTAMGLWLGSYAQPGNGHKGPALDACFATLRGFGAVLQIPLHSIVVRADGEFGKPSYAARLAREGVRLLTRLSTYSVLRNDPAVRAALQRGSTQRLHTPDSPVQRELFEVPAWTWGQGEHARVMRLVVTRYALDPQIPHGVGHRDGAWIYELFVTDLDASVSTAEVVSLYLGRGLLEATFAQEDAELRVDRTWTDHAPGQDLMQSLGQAVWNTRVLLGRSYPSAARATRTMDWPVDVRAIDSGPVAVHQTPQEDEATTATAATAASAPCARPAAKAPLFGPQDFTRVSAREVRCPAGHAMRIDEYGGRGERAVERWRMPSSQCLDCEKRAQCRKDPESASPRRVTLPVVPSAGRPPRERAARGCAALLEPPAPKAPVALVATGPVRTVMQYVDQAATRFRAQLREALLRQRVTLDRRDGCVRVAPRGDSRDQRAHRRRTRRVRGERNARMPDDPTIRVTLHGIWDELARLLRVAENPCYRPKPWEDPVQLRLLD